MLKTNKELLKDLDDKICFLERQINDVKKEALESNLRIQFSYAIATTLRSIVCYDQNERSLIARCGLDKKILFKFGDDPAHAMNELPSYLLLSYTLTADKNIFAFPSESINDLEHISQILLSFKNWLEEIVIDPKLPSVFPLTRFDVIKILADQNGAHVDSNKDERIVELSKVHSFPMKIEGEEKDREVQAKTILSETVIAIAMELIFSYKYLIQKDLTAYGASNFLCYVHGFNDKSKKLITFIKEYKLAEYETNKFFPCKFEVVPLSTYKIRFRDKYFFPITIINI